MRRFEIPKINFVGFCIVTLLLPVIALAADYPDPETYVPSIIELEKHKKPFDDPRPYLNEFGPKQVLPKELYSRLSFDMESMKNLWAEVIGFKAPDVVGKIAPEIKPGKYTYKDLEKYPGFKELMWPDLYNRIKPGGPPHAGNIPEFEIIPTRQYYWALPISKATKQNFGKTKLDKDGYLIPETWEGGVPFPQPSGQFKAQQAFYNFEKRYISWGQNHYLIFRPFGLTKNLKFDFEGLYQLKGIGFGKRVLSEPYGWFDQRAKEEKEMRSFIFHFLAPRDISGTVLLSLYYLDPDKADQSMIYVPSLRRVRKLTSTDTQDPIMGQDLIYDDNDCFTQKISKNRYPYKYEIIAEREYLVPSATIDGSEYISSQGYEFRNIKMERRPIYVIKMTQLDKNYVYGHRILYLDKEVFLNWHLANYDQKGRLYRTVDHSWGFAPEMGMFSYSGMLLLMRDHLDLHSSIQQMYQIPAFWSRSNLSLEGIVKKAK